MKLIVVHRQVFDIYAAMRLEVVLYNLKTYHESIILKELNVSEL